MVNRFAQLFALSLIIVLGASCSIAEVIPRGPVEDYEVIEEINQGNEESPYYDVKVTTDVVGDDELQFIAQDVILKRFKDNNDTQAVIVGFYAGSANLGAVPYAQMLWNRSPAGILDRIGLSSNDPFADGIWQWDVSEDQGSSQPDISIDEPIIEDANSVRFAGRVTRSDSELAYEVYSPRAELVAARETVVLDADSEFEFVWQPPEGFDPIEGQYVFRFALGGGGEESMPELWAKIDFEKALFIGPVEYIDPGEGVDIAE